eukprot:13405903-Ditylum_brightwellii.AAC.1
MDVLGHHAWVVFFGILEFHPMRLFCVHEKLQSQLVFMPSVLIDCNQRWIPFLFWGGSSSFPSEMLVMGPLSSSISESSEADES